MKMLLYFVGGFIIGAVIAWLLLVGWTVPNKAEAIGVHTEWGEWTDVSPCIATTCGSSEGLKDQERVCVAGGCGRECSLAHQECDKGCPTVENWTAYRCDNGYSYWVLDGKCHKPGHSPRNPIDTFSIASFIYEKSADPNHCHRPTAASLGVPSWAVSSFNGDNPEWKNTIDVNCHEVPAEEQTRQVKCEAEIVECEVTPEVTPTPAEEPRQGGGSDVYFPGSTTEAPVCDETTPLKQAINFHVYRNGDSAILKWWPDEAENVNIYYKQNDSPVWQYAVGDLPNNGYYEVHGLGGMDITFALQQANGCAGGQVQEAIVIDGLTAGWVLFR